jgi:hypothetical protein
MYFVIIPTAQNSYIGLKTLFFLITPTPKFWHWRNQFYRIESGFVENPEFEYRRNVQWQLVPNGTKQTLQKKTIGNHKKTWDFLG